jgi:hypothetical protein
MDLQKQVLIFNSVLGIAALAATVIMALSAVTGITLALPVIIFVLGYSTVKYYESKEVPAIPAPEVETPGAA